MVDLVVDAGVSGGYSGGTQILGRAPAKGTAGTVTSLELHNHVTWTNPTDPVWSEVGIYRAPYVSGDSAATFPGGSPIWAGRAQNFNDHSTTARAAVQSYWAVWFDRYGNPNPITSANAVYIGHG